MNYFSAFKSIVIIFPILTGALLTGWGTAKLGEANLVTVGQWNAPHGLLVFSSEQLSRLPHVHVGAHLSSLAPVEGNTVPTDVELNFGWDWGHPEYAIPEEVTVGVQFPFGVVNYQNFEITITKEDDQPIPFTDKKVIVTVKEGVLTSVFYVSFNPLQEHDWQNYKLSISFDWEGVIHRESYSVFTITLPVVLGIEPGLLEYPYEQCPNVHYTYYGENLELTVGMEIPWDLNIKQILPSTEVIRTEVEGPLTRSIFLEPQLCSEGPVSGKDIQLIIAEFEVRKLSETRDRLLFDSGLYMGLGVALVFSGIHEALKVISERRKKA